jgi:hypothetical protein
MGAGGAVCVTPLPSRRGDFGLCGWYARKGKLLPATVGVIERSSCHNWQFLEIVRSVLSDNAGGKKMKSFRLPVITIVFFGFLTFGQTSEGNAAPPNPQPPQVAPQHEQCVAQQQDEFADCYDVAKMKTGGGPHMLNSVAPGVKTPGMEGLSAATGASAKALPSASTKAMLANAACLKARGYLIKHRAPKAAPPQQ